MGFVNDEVQPVGFLSHGIRQRLPNGILPPVRMLCQIAGLGELLCVQEIDVPILQHFHIKGIVADRDALIQTDLVRLQVDLQPRLLIELRGIRKPNENGFVLIRVQFVAVVNRLDQRGHDDGLACAGRCSIGDHLRCMCAAVIAQRDRHALTQSGKRRLLERE